MIGFILALALLGVAVLALVLQRTYAAVAAHELKRRARTDDPAAQVMYTAVAYGPALRGLLWLVAVLAAAGAFQLFSLVAWQPLAFATVALTLGYGFIWIPSRKPTAAGLWLAVRLTPAIVWLLERIHPVFDWFAGLAHRHRPAHSHTGLYEPEDLLRLIERQRRQPDSRISGETLELLEHGLTFGDKLVRDCMVPRRKVEALPETAPVSPALIDELHSRGFSRVPVYKDGNDGKIGSAATDDDDEHIDFVGTLYLQDLITLKATGTVGDVMHRRIYYVHEDHPLEQVLDAFLKTHQHMFIVVNSFREFVGLITIEDILEQILGAKIVDEFDQYDDIRAVAGFEPAAVGGDRPEDDGITDETVANPYPKDTLKHVIHEAGFRGEALETAYAVALAESGGEASAHNDDASTGDDSYGLFQINMLGDMGSERRETYGLQSDDELFDPLTNARAAFELSRGGTDWQPWSVYGSGAYRKHLNTAANRKLA